MTKSISLKKTTTHLTLILYLLSLGTPLWSQPIHPKHPLPIINTQSHSPFISPNAKEPVFSYPLTPDIPHKIVYQGVTLHIPAGAVEEETIITIEKLTQVKGVNETINNVTSRAAGYRFGPHPFRFKKNISVTISYDERVNQSNTTLSDLKIWFYNESLKTWESLPVTTVDRQKNCITAMTNHFTDMITGTLTLPESPGVLDFNPNSIKNLESVMPDTGVPQIQGLTGQAMGGASFSLPLNLPPGRGKAYPLLDLNYNVNRRNSWLGRGFDLSLPAVTIDTRFGLPRYNGQDSYMLAGEALVLNRNPGNGIEEYSLRTESTFQRIRHIRNDHDPRGPDYWIITDKEGTTQYFGGIDATSGPDSKQVYIWHLQEKIDANGNRVLYHYEQESHHLYLKNINWSGHGLNRGPYNIDFIRIPRVDIRTDGRGKYIDSLGSLLDRIDISYEGEIFRSYQFDYLPNMFEQNQLVRFSETDGKNEIFYSYDFEYHQAPKVGEGQAEGYTGFIMDEWEADPKPLGDSQSSSTGFSLGLTIGFQGWSFYWLGAKKVWLWQVGFNAGGGSSLSWQTGDLIDLNGNGLPDMVYQNGNRLTGLINEGDHFGGGITFTGFDGILNNSFQSYYSLGGSAGLGPATVSVTYQDSNSFQYSALVDVNGDGFLDMVSSNSGSYLKNMNTPHSGVYQFEATHWLSSLTDSQNYLPRQEISDEERENYQRSYYIETPVLRWKAYKPGVIRAVHNLKLTDPDQLSPDGLRVIMDYSEENSLSREIDSTQNITYEDRVSVEQGREFYFLLDPVDDIISQERDPGFIDNLFWSTSVDYERIAWFAHSSQNQALFDIPLKDKTDLKQAAALGRFIPVRLTTTDFDTLYYYEDPLYNYRHKAVLQTLYLYDSTSNMFLLREGVREDPSALSLLRSCLYRRLPPCFTPAELSRLAFNNFDEEEIIILEREGNQNGFSYEKDHPALNSLFQEGSIYIDRVYKAESDNQSYLDYYLNEDDLTVILINEAGQEVDRLPCESDRETLLDKGELHFIHNDTLFFYHIDWADYPREINSVFYHKTIYPKIMESEEIRLFPHKELSLEYYLTLTENLEDPGPCERLYKRAGEFYRLLSPEEYTGDSYEEDYITLVSEIDKDKTSMADSVFSGFPITPSAKRVTGFIKLTPLEQDFLIDTGGFEPQDFLDLEDYLLIDPALSEETQEAADKALSRYRAYKELFPCYTEEEDSFLLASGILSEEEISVIINLFLDLNLKSPQKIHVSYLYNEDHLFAVGEKRAEQAITTLPVNTRDSAPSLIEANENYPCFSLIRTREDRSYTKSYPIHPFNSTHDYSLEDRRGAYLKDKPEGPLFELPPLPEDDNSLLPLKPYLEQTVEENRAENSFAGGFRNWSYGFFSLYHEYDWDSERIGQDDYEQNTYYSREEANQKNAKVVKPPYMVAAKEHDQRWTGTISDYSQSEVKLIGGQVETVYRNYQYSPHLSEESIWHPMRKGGLTYYSSPACQSSVPPPNGSPFDFTDFQHSKSTAITYSGGIGLGFAGVNGGFTESTALGIRTFRDINGDSYPDIITAHGGNLTALLGGQEGFQGGLSYAGGFSSINKTINTTITAGASVVPGGKLEDLIYSPQSVPIATTVLADYEGGTIGSVGINGTETTTESHIELIDINGDSLPDHIQSSHGGSYDIRLNGGDRFIAVPSWNNGTPYALSHHVTGALGASLSGGIGVAGLSGGINGNVSKTDFQLIDMNGDALPDQVEKKSAENYFRVRFNRGSSFTKEIKIYCPTWNYNIDSYLAQLTSDMAGMTGFNINNMEVISNLGSIINLEAIQSQSPLAAAASPFTIHDTISSSTGTSLSLGAGITLSLSYLLLVFTISPGINGTRAESKTSITIKDMNGDGAPEHLFKNPAAPLLSMRVNQLSRVGILTAINLPQGGRYELEYGMSKNTPADPHSRRNLTGLTRKETEPGAVPGAVDNILEYHVAYSYEKGFYDRQEREFFGYQNVITHRADGSRVETEYHNQQYHLKGRPKNRTAYDTEGAEYNRTEYFYNTRLIPGSPSHFVYIQEEGQTQTDRAADLTMEKRTIYDYDNKGNLVELISEVPGEREDQNYLLIMDYHSNESTWIVGLPRNMEVYAGTNVNQDKLLRKRTAQYDSRGNLTELHEHYGKGQDQISSTFLTYDAYGNRVSETDPGGYRINYTYGKHKQYIEQVQDKDYTSTMTWDKRFALKTRESEINGNIISRKYDSFGRIKEIRTSYDTGPVPAVQYSYDTEQYPWRSLCRNKISHQPDKPDTLDTVVTIDGLGRISQIATEGVITNIQEEGQIKKQRGWITSGPIWYDAMARPVKEGQPQFQANDYTLPLVGEEYPQKTPMTGETNTKYDPQGRIKQLEMADGSLWTTGYAISLLTHTVDNPPNNTTLPLSNIIQTDPLGNITETCKNSRGHVVSIIKKDKEGTILTAMNYSYNPLGELLGTRDIKGNELHFTYDLSGRTIKQQSPNAGVQEFRYNRSGLLISKRDSKLINQGKFINYEYDSHNRLVTVDYPFSENITYQYGTSKENNQLGRLERVTNGRTTTLYEYGKIGEITAQVRTIKRQTPNQPDETARFEYVTNYQGQIEEILYPDQERLTYIYDRGGQIQSAVGNRINHTFPYIEDIGYDEYGQRVYIKYNSRNGVETTYQYDKERRWLNHLETVKSDWNRIYQNINYEFDRVGNILTMENRNTHNHSTQQEYTYNNLYQITGATGSYQLHRNGNMITYSSNYTQTFTYDKIGNMTGKTSSEQQNPPTGMTALNYNSASLYYPAAPHRAEQIGNMYYRYDAGGNTTEERMGGHRPQNQLSPANYTRLKDNTTMANQPWAWYRTTPEQDSTYSRQYHWDEENRLTGTSDPIHTVSYTYDHEGNRAGKKSTLGETLYFDKMWTATNTGTKGELRRTKNIYVGETCLAAKMNYNESSLDYEKNHQYYYHTDHLNSSNVVTDYEGNIFEHHEYTPYGETWIEDQKTGALEETILRYTSKEKDRETGFYYMNARYMNPPTSRWISPDPAGYLLMKPMTEDKLYQNPYAYVSHKPLKYTDPTGLKEGISETLNAHNRWLRRAHQYERKEYTYEELIQIAEKAGLMGRKYQTGFLCDDFGEALFSAMGIDKTEYLPNGAESLVTTNMDTLNNNKTLQKTPTPGWNVFYKRMDNGKEGHFGFVYMADNGTHTFLHNGWSPDGIRKVNVHKRRGHNPDAFFRFEQEFNMKFIPLKGR